MIASLQNLIKRESLVTPPSSMSSGQNIEIAQSCRESIPESVSEILQKVITLPAPPPPLSCGVNEYIYFFIKLSNTVFQS